MNLNSEGCLDCELVLVLSSALDIGAIEVFYITSSHVLRCELRVYYANYTRFHNVDIVSIGMTIQSCSQGCKQGPDPQGPGQGPGPQGVGQDKDLKYVLKEFLRTRTRTRTTDRQIILIAY